MSSVNLATAWVEVVPSVRGIKGGIAKALAPGDQEAAKAGKRQGGRFTGAFKAGIVGVGGALAAVGIGKFVTEAVTGAGQLQQSIGAIESVFGKSSGKMQKWSASAAQNVGLTKNEFNELGTLIGAQLKNGGTAMDKLAPKTKNLIGVGADLSSMFGGTTKDAVAALSSALKGERDPIEAYGVSLSQTKIDAEAAALGFDKVGNSLSAEATQAATLSLIMKQTKDAHGNFAKEAETFAGAQQRMVAQWGNLVTTVGGFVIPIMTKLFKWISDTGLPALKQFGGWIMSDVVPALKVMGQWVRDNVLPVLSDLGGRIASVLVPALKDFGKWIRDVALPAIQEFGRWIVSTALPALGRLGRWFVENRETIAKFAGVITAIMLPVLVRLAVRFAAVGVAAVVSSVKQVAAWVASQGAAVKAGVVHVIQSYKIVASWVRMAAAAVVSGAQTVIIWAMYKAEAIKAAAVYVAQSFRVVAAWVRMSAAAVISGAKTKAVWLGTMASSAAKGAGRFLLSTGRVIAGWALMAVKSLFQAGRMAAAWFIALGPIGWITGAVIAIVALIIANWSKIKKWTVKIWSAVVDWIVGAWKKVKKWTVNLLTAVYDWVYDKMWALSRVVRKVYTAIVDAISGAWKKAKKWTKDILTAVVKWVVDKFTGLRDTGRKLWDKITGVITGAWGKIRDKSKEILRAVVIWVLNKFRDVRDTGRDIWNKLKSIISGVWDGITGSIKKAWGFIRDKVFEPLKNAVAKIPNAFEKAKDGIGKAWDKLKSIAKAPVKFVVNRVINDGLIGTFNKIPGVDLPKIKLPKGFAKGGLARGWSMVGEEGPELVNFTNPGRVYTARQTGAALKHTEDTAVSSGMTQSRRVPGLWDTLLTSLIRSRGNRVNINPGGPSSFWQMPGAAAVLDGVSGLKVGMGMGAPRIDTHNDPAPRVPGGIAYASFPNNVGYSPGGGRFSPTMRRAVSIHEIMHLLGFPHASGNTIMQPTLGAHMVPTSRDIGLLRQLFPGGSGKLGKGDAKPENPFLGLVNKMVDAIRERFPAGGMFIDAAVGLAKAGIGKVTSWVGDLAKNLGSKIAGVAGNVVDGIKGFFGFAAKGQLHDNGGKILPGTTLVDNQSRKPEALLNARQWSTAHRAMEHVERQANGPSFPSVVRLVVGDREFDAYVDTRAVAATGGALNTADDRLRYGGKYVGAML